MLSLSMCRLVPSVRRARNLIYRNGRFAMPPSRQINYNTCGHDEIRDLIITPGPIIKRVGDSTGGSVYNRKK